MSNFSQTTIDLFGEAGRAWLDGLPDLVATLGRLWGVRIDKNEPPFDLSYNYVAPVIQANGEPAVLKIGFPRPEITREIDALRLYGGRGSCRLLAADPARGGLLLERLQPGTMLVTLADDDAATRIAAGTMAELWQPLPADHPFLPVETWAAGLDEVEGAAPLPVSLVDRARRLFAELFASAPRPVLIHGDLHHYNILAATRAPWLAIDPKGVAGEPAYEAGAWLRNPLGAIRQWPDPGRVVRRRIDIFAAELSLDRERITGYALAQAVLSAWWMVEDHGRGWEEPLALAEILAGV